MGVEAAPPLTFTKEASGKYRFIFTGELFTDEIDLFSYRIKELLKAQPREVKEISLDISPADAFAFKPRRFFGICGKLLQYRGENYEQLGLRVVINRRQRDIYREIIDELGLRTEVVTDDLSETLRQEETRGALPLSVFAWLGTFIIVYFGVFLYTWHFLKDGLLRFGINFSLGILFYELYLLLTLKNKHDERL